MKTDIERKHFISTQKSAQKRVENILDSMKQYARQYYLTAEENDSEENLKKKEDKIRSILQKEIQKREEAVRAERERMYRGIDDLQHSYMKGSIEDGFLEIVRETLTQPNNLSSTETSTEREVEEFRKKHSEKCDGVHAGWCGGEKISDHTDIIIEDIRASFTRIQQETERRVVEMVADAIEENTSFYENKYGGNYEQCGRDIKFSLADALHKLTTPDHE